MVWGQNQSQRNYVGQMGMGNMNMQGMGSLGMGAGGRGILGEPPVSGSSMGMSGLNNMQGMVGSSSSSDNIDTMIQQRRLQQQLSLRESQLALASNLLQKQNQLIMDVGMPANIGPMLPSPTGMSRSMIPSLLDMPSSRHTKRTGPSMNRDLDMKRRRRDSSSPSDHQRGRNRSSDLDRRRDSNRYSPSRRREEHTSRRDRPSRFSRRDSDELLHRRSRNELEEYDPAKPTDDEMPGLELADEYRHREQMPPVGEKSPFYCHVCDMECSNDQSFRDHMSSARHKDRMSDVLRASSKKSSHVEARLKAQEHLKRIESTRVGFCKLCDQELGIPFLRHKLTTLHKKREMQVRKGCGWCGVKSFLNFSEVLKHRERQTHKENAAKYGKKPETSFDMRTDTRSGRSSNLVTLDSVGYSKDGEDRRSRPRTGASSRTAASGRSGTSRFAASSRSATSAKSDTKEVDLCPELQFDAETAIGQNYVIPVSGFFCKLCHKFYNSETAAKVTHCKSQQHFLMFKKAKNAAKARALAEKKASTPVSAEDETKSVQKETDKTEAEQEGDEQEPAEEAAEKDEKTENEGQEEAEKQNGESEDTKGPDESEEGQGEAKEGQASEAAEDDEQDEEANGGMKAEADNYPEEEDEKQLTEEEREEKLLGKEDNESETEEMPGDVIFDEDDEGDTAIIDLADGSSETAADEKDTEVSVQESEDTSVQESEDTSEQVDENVEEVPAIDTSPVVRGRSRGRGRAVGRRGRRGKK